MLPVIVILAFIITFALATSFFFFFVETPLARKKMMTRLSALQEVHGRNSQVGPSSAGVRNKADGTRIERKKGRPNWRPFCLGDLG